MAPDLAAECRINIFHMEGEACKGYYKEYLFTEKLEFRWHYSPHSHSEEFRRKYLDRAEGTLVADLNGKNLMNVLKKLPSEGDIQPLPPLKTKGKDAFKYEIDHFTTWESPFIFHVLLPKHSWCRKDCILKKKEDTVPHKEDVFIDTYKNIEKQSITWICRKLDERDPSDMTLHLGIAFFKPDKNVFDQIEKISDPVNENEKAASLIGD